MKRYNVNWYNGWRFLWEALVVATLFALCIYFTVLILITFWIAGIVMLILLAGSFFYQLNRLISGLINCFYFDEKNNEIILKLIGRKKVRIPISSIGRIYPKVNENPKKGAVTTVSENSNGAEMTQKVFAVQDTEGNDLFYIRKDPKILGLFESLGIEIIYKKEE